MNDFSDPLYRLGGLTPVPGNLGKVLVVEDSRTMMEIITAHLSSLEVIEVVKATSMAEAQQLLKDNPRQFLCAVLDLNLPDAPDGEVVDLVQGQDIPVIILTGSINDAVRQTMQDKLVIDYVAKRQPSEIRHVTYLVGRIYENQQTKVLVVDDAASYCNYLTKLLENYRYRIFAAGDGVEALKVLSAHPDIVLIITDYNMPHMNGLQLIEEVRRQYRREDLAIIGLSDAAERDLSVRLLKMGANDFINKSFQVEEFYCRVTQMTNMIGYTRKIREYAIRDYLTNVYNRRHFFELGKSIYANAQRKLITVAAAMIDVDFFKKVNDTYGHAAGDRVLQVISDTLRNTLRSSDIVARFGGEEFVCLAILKQEVHASLVFEKVRAALEAVEITIENGEQIHVTVSIGVTTGLSDSFDQMLNVADAALYKAKASGRNRVVCIQA